MKRILLLPALLVAIALTPMSAEAHCNATDGPVATAAVKALDTRSINLVLPYAPAQAEPELMAVFE